ncbi:MAG TPA: hypothetical protein PLS10_10335 [Chitinophagales bacterium]|jgi:hypothetical protein|nr:hypothetical protein [Chitinophagales bacterium]
MKKTFFILTTAALFAFSCTKPEEDTGPRLIFKFKFDSTQIRLNNFGNASVIPAGNAAQSPKFNLMGAHYIELAPDSTTILTTGEILYKASEVTTGGSTAIDFSKEVVKGEGQEFFSVPLKNITPGFYKWLRVSLAYQNFDVNMIYRTNSYNSGNPISLNGTVAAFIGFDTYITSYKVKDQTVTVNANKKQGYGAVEITNLPLGAPAQVPFTWQSPSGATTVPNPISITSPIPPGSCVVTGRFPAGLTITGNETNDIVITVSISTNKSFEWKDKNSDGLFEPVDGLNSNAVLDSVVDMGVRGLIPYVN